MAIDLKWDTDISLGSTGDFEVVTGSAAVAQRIRLRLKTVQGSYPLNLRFGLPVFTQILGQSAANTAGVRGLIAQKVGETPGVASVSAPTFAFDPALRALSYTVAATLATGETIEVTA